MFGSKSKSNRVDKKTSFEQATDPASSLIKFRVLGAFLGLFIILKIAASFLPTPKLSFASDLSPENILRAVNEQRSLRNLVTLNTNGKLSWAGQSKAQDMQARHYFSHQDPDGKYIWDKIVAAGYTPYTQLGENLAIEFYDTESLIAAWMNSPTHRANILQEGFKDQGMGLAFGQASEGQYHSAVVNAFGALAVSPQPKPATSPASKPKASPSPAAPAPKPAPAPAAVPTPPAPAPAPQPQAPIEPPTENQHSQDSVKLRVKLDEVAMNNKEANFTLPSHNQQYPTASSNEPEEENLPEAVVGNLNTNESADGKTNRYLILIFGAGLFLFLLSDLKEVIEKRLHHFDKKINNLLVLLIALAVIAFIYWL